MTIESSVCETCKRPRPILLAMAPGADGLPYHLCAKCWLEGVVTRQRPPLPVQPTERVIDQPTTKPKRGKGRAN